jgi:c-di-GMP-related signal transduction protein
MDKVIIRIVDPSIINEQVIDESTCQKEDKYMKYLVRTTFISCLRSNNKYLNYLTYILLNLALIGSIFSMLWYPTYYISQPIIWTLDLVIVFITFNYLCYLFQNIPI